MYLVAMLPIGLVHYGLHGKEGKSCAQLCIPTLGEGDWIARKDSGDPGGSKHVCKDPGTVSHILPLDSTIRKER